MRSNEALLLDMLIAARKIQKFIAGLTEDFFKSSDLHQSAVVRELQIIGEAAWQIADEFKQEHPEIAWAEIAGMRNRIIHEYFRVDLKLIGQTVHGNIPQLIAQLQPLVPPDIDLVED